MIFSVDGCPGERYHPQSQWEVYPGKLDLEQQAGTGHLTNRPQNHTLSDSVDEILTLQGVSWLTRKIINNATITLYIEHYKDNGVERIDIEQTLTGGISASPEYRTLDWTFRKSQTSLFGPVTGRSRRIPVAEVTDEYLKSGWLPDVSRDDAIESYTEADKEKNVWKSDMVSGSSRWVVDLARVDVIIQRRSGVSKTSTASVVIPEGSDSQAQVVKTLRLASSMIMVCHWLSELPEVSLKLFP